MALYLCKLDTINPQAPIFSIAYDTNLGHLRVVCRSANAIQTLDELKASVLTHKYPDAVEYNYPAKSSIIKVSGGEKSMQSFKTALELLSMQKTGSYTFEGRQYAYLPKHMLSHEDFQKVYDYFKNLNLLPDQGDDKKNRKNNITASVSIEAVSGAPKVFSKGAGGGSSGWAR